MDTKTDTNGYRHILKYTGLLGSVQGLIIVMALVRSKLMALLLGTSGVGMLSLFNSAARMVGDVTNLGIPTSAVKTVSQTAETSAPEALADHLTVVRSWAVVTAVAGMLLCALLSPLLDTLFFAWGNHRLHLIVLSPAVAFTTLAGCEMAILKGTHRLRQLTMAQVAAAVGALVTSIPLYWAFGASGIVPSLVIIAVVAWLCAIHYSWRVCPPRLSLRRAVLAKGHPMVKLGVAFVLVYVVNSLADLAIRSFLSHEFSLEDLGIYNVGYMLVITYGGLVFTAIDTDYYPRLSAVAHDTAAANRLINRQICAALILVTPLLVALAVALPLLVPLLFSAAFSDAVPMAGVLVPALFLRGIKLPLAYLAPARGRSRAYFLLESAYALLLVVLVVVAYRHWQFVGAGAAILLADLLETLWISVYCRRAHGFHYAAATLRLIALLLPLLLMGCAAAAATQGLLHWLLGALLTLAAAALSYHLYRRHERGDHS